MKLTASRLEVAETCMGSAVYDGIESIDTWSDMGVAKHAFFYDALNEGRAAALAKVADKKHREACERFNLEKLPAGQPGRWAGEVAFALDVETGVARELGRGLGRRYRAAGLKPTEIPGTIDLLGMADDALIPLDYKTGWTRVTTAKSNLQLLFAAVCSTQVYERPLARGAILYPGEDGENPYFDSAEWDAFELDEARLRIMALGKAVLEARERFQTHDPVTGEVSVKPRLVVGRHCRYCPVLTTCPAQGALVRRLVATPAETEEDLKRGLSENSAAALVYRRLVSVKEAVDRALSVVYARAAAMPIDLGNGSMLGEHVSSREVLDAEVVADVVTEMYGAALVPKAVEMKATKASVERMARAVKETKGGTITEKKNAVLDAVRAREGVSFKESRRVTEYTPERLLAAGETS